jgi:hypothetical protein
MQSTQGEQTTERPDGIMAKDAPKAIRKASVSNAKTYNKNVKTVVKDSSSRSDGSSVVALNKSGGKKPFSKNTHMPSSPAVPKKGKK